MSTTIGTSYDFSQIEVGSPSTETFNDLPSGTASSFKIVDASGNESTSPFDLGNWSADPTSVVVTFSPTEAQSYSGYELQALDSSGAVLSSSAIDGEGIITGVSFSPDSVDMVDTVVGQTSTASVSVTNDCGFNVDLTLSDASVFTVSPASVAAGKTKEVEISFTPPSSQAETVTGYSTTLTATSSDPSLAQSSGIPDSLTAYGIGIDVVQAQSSSRELGEGLGYYQEGGASGGIASRQFRVYVPDNGNETALLLGKKGVDAETGGFGLFSNACGMVASRGGISILAGGTTPVADVQQGSGTESNVTTAMSGFDFALSTLFTARSVHGLVTSTPAGHRLSTVTGAVGLAGAVAGLGLGIGSFAGGNTPSGVSIYGDGGLLLLSPMYTSIHSELGLTLTSLFPVLAGMVDAEVFAMNAATLTGERKATMQSNRSSTVTSAGDVEISAKGGGFALVGTDKKGDVNIDAGNAINLRAKSKISIEQPGQTISACSSNTTAKHTITTSMENGKTVLTCSDQTEIKAGGYIMRVASTAIHIAYDDAARKKPFLGIFEDRALLSVGEKSASMDLKSGKVEIFSKEGGAKITLEGDDVTITTPGKTKLDASGAVEVSGKTVSVTGNESVGITTGTGGTGLGMYKNKNCKWSGSKWIFE